jgi:hypothetical protein
MLKLLFTRGPMFKTLVPEEVQSMLKSYATLQAASAEEMYTQFRERFGSVAIKTVLGIVAVNEVTLGSNEKLFLLGCSDQPAQTTEVLSDFYHLPGWPDLPIVHLDN